MAEVNNVPRFETICVKKPWVIHVSKDNPANFCPICNQLNATKGQCMIVRELIWESQTAIEKKVGPNFGGPPKPRDSSLQKARVEIKRNCSNPHLIHRLN
jgi:hypothetical protein